MAAQPWFDYSLGQGYTLPTGGSHDGRDVQTPTGTPLTNLLPGTVTAHTGWFPWGGEVDIKTASGVTETWAHLDALAVKPGDVVQAGQIIGLSGGENLPLQYSNGPHTHFSVFAGDPWDNTRALDPTPLLQWAQSNFTGSGPGGLGDVTTAGSAAGVTQTVTGSAGGIAPTINITIQSALSTALGATGLKFQDAAKRTGLIMIGGALVILGFFVFVWPAEKAAATGLARGGLPA